MRTKILLAAASVVAILTACSSQSDKSITEPLTADEKRELFSHGIVSDAFVLAEKLQAAPLFNEFEIRFSEITYSRASDFFKSYFDWKPDEAKAEWDRLYQSKLDSVPAIMAKYAQDVRNNLPEKKYLDVKWTASLVGDGYTTDNAEIVFTLTPKGRTIEEFYLTYGLIDREDSASWMKFSTLLHDCNSIHGTDVAQTTEFRSWLKYRDDEIEEEDFNRLTTGQLMAKYYWGMLLRVKIGGKWYSEQDYIDTLPVSVRLYMEEQKKNHGQELTDFTRVKDVAQDFFGIEIPDKDDFVEQRHESFAQQLDPLVYEAFELVRH